MIEETLKRYKIEARELTEKLGLNGDLSFITYNNMEDTIIIEVLIKDNECGCGDDVEHPLRSMCVLHGIKDGE